MDRFMVFALAHVLASALLLGCGGGGGGSSIAAVQPAPVPTAQAPQAMKCADVSTQSLSISGLIVAKAAALPASGTSGTAGSYPAHCVVTGTINARTGIDGKTYAIGFDLRLPESGWNGKFYYAGDGGLGGAVTTPDAMDAQSNPLLLGYAMASSDSGHVGSAPAPILDGSFGVDPQARIDYGYNALGTWAPLAKKIVGQFYGQPPSRSYFVGCSKGGQSGMQAAARFADQFDGIVAGNPGFNLPKAGAEALFHDQQLATVNDDVTKAFTTVDLALVSSRILAKCDALDGAADGIVNDMAACRAAFNFSMDVPACAAGAAPDGTCLSAAQKTALKSIMEGAKTSGGTLLYSDWPWDPGIASTNWFGWKTVMNVTLSPTAMANVFTTPPTTGVSPFSPAANTYWRSFDVSRSYDLIYGTSATYTVSAMEFMVPPHLLNLSTLKKKSKLLVYHGAADGIFSVNDTINWYAKLKAGDVNVGDYARLFVVPGMGHCSGGPATDRFDAFAALVKWVEEDVAPERILATIDPASTDKPSSWSKNRSRPLCPFPTTAVLKAGATDLESADSFVCQ